MYRIKISSIFFLVVFTPFALISMLIFDKVNITSHIVVDEEFHLHLGEAYCRYEFDKWHPKITTFPGLYLLSSLLFGSFNLCSTFWLRFTSLLFSFVNMILFYFLLNGNNENPSWQNVISALNLALLPPLYFFSHLYYTDVVSLTMILCLFLFFQKGNHYVASIFGMFAVLCRQTNIIWVGMVFGSYVLQELIKQQRETKGSSYKISTTELIQFLKRLPTNFWKILSQTNFHFWLNSFCYISLLLVFLLFVYINGSIVVGDKSAHEATIHVPQLFYFSLFCLFFAWPHFIAEVWNFLQVIRRHKTAFLFTLVLSIIVVHYNTLVHPYLLADNRHYIFYIWTRFYGKYFMFRYLIIPIYLFSWFAIIRKIINNRDVTFLLLFVTCTSVVLMTQKLIELRYFFIPFVLFRIHIKNVPLHSMVYEFLTYVVLNICTLSLFFTKTIEWQDFDYPQRLIW